MAQIVLHLDALYVGYLFALSYPVTHVIYSLFDMDGTLVDSTAGVVGAWELFRLSYPSIDVHHILSCELRVDFRVLLLFTLSHSFPWSSNGRKSQKLLWHQGSRDLGSTLSLSSFRYTTFPYGCSLVRVRAF
jgi:hypothetical protein